jgi:hypothetical protein
MMKIPWWWRQYAPTRCYIPEGSPLQGFSAFSITIRRDQSFLIEKGQSVSHFEHTRCVCDLALTDFCGHLNVPKSKMQWKCWLVSELYNNVLTFWMKLLLFTSQLLNNICHYPNCQKIFQQQRSVHQTHWTAPEIIYRYNCGCHLGHSLVQNVS